MKDGQNLTVGDAHVTPRHIQEVHASQLGDAQGIPFFIDKNIRSSFKTLYFIASYNMCYSWSIICFAFSFFVFFAVVYGWIVEYLFGERHALFSLSRTLQFLLLLFCECSLFASTAFSSCFPLIFCSELVGLLPSYMISSLVFDDYYL